MANLIPDFESPLTAALFDRTPEQRERRAKILAQIAVQNDGILSPDARQDADRIMFGEFLTELGATIANKETELLGRSINAGPSVDTATVALMARTTVTAAIGEWHAALPVPMIERLRPE